MNRTRHTVERIRPDISHSFDQQFWPVLMAIIVLCSITAGAIVTLIKGPWMWGSLLILPAAAGITILVLYRLNDSLLRRSLQFAILTSLALHLLVLIITSLTFIFGNELQQRKLVVAKSPERKITVSNRANKFVHQQPRKHTVTETEMEEPERHRETTTTVRPQPTPVVEPEKQVQQQVVKRKIEQTTVPRIEKQLSKRSRNSEQVKPTVAKKLAQPKTSKSENPQVTQNATPRPSETVLQKRVQAHRSHADKQSPAAASKSRVTEALASRRQTEASRIADQSGQATARIRNDSPRIPKIAIRETSNSASSQPTKSTSSTVKADPSKATISRQQPVESASRKTNSTVQPNNPTSVRAVASRNTNRANSGIAIQTSPATNRQSVARTPSTANRLQQQSALQSASANRNNANPQPQNVAVSRSTSGKIGAGRSQNLERMEGGQPSPVSQASNASHKRQSNRMANNIAMSALQQSSHLERGKASASQRALRNENVKWAKRSGSANPDNTTLQAAAARIDSAMANAAGKQAAEKGASMLDIGSTKVTPERISDRRGGGGLPNLDNNVSQTMSVASGRQSTRVPNVSKSIAGNAVQPAGATAPSSLAVEQANTSGQLERSSTLPQSVARNQTEVEDTPSSTGSPRAVRSVATRRESGGGESSFAAPLMDDESEFGNARSRIAKAPNIEGQVNFGSAGQQNIQVVEAHDDGSESATTEMVRRANDATTGGSIVGTASKIVASSMAGLPLFGKGAGESRRRSEREAVLEGDDAANSTTRSSLDNMPSVTSSSINTPEANDSSANALTDLAVTDDNEQQPGSLERQAFNPQATSPSVVVELDEVQGPGGLAQVATRRIGSVTESITDAEFLSPNRDARFKRRQFGGLPAVSPDAVIAKQAFRNRNPAALADSGPQTEAAIERGLEFLARYQLADGSWTLGQFDTENPLFQNQLNSDTAATGLALLAFQGAGYNHRQYKYATQVKRAIDWLIENQSKSGGLYVESDEISNRSCRMYSHAIAALALTEAYGMTQDPELQEPTQKALDYIANTQDSRKGGWRYFDENRKRSTDTSVTGWMMMALKSGDLAGLDVEDYTLEKIENWLDIAEDPDAASQFRYNPYAVDSDGKARLHGRQASTTMTSVGLLMRVYTGWGPTDERFLAGTDSLLKQLPGDQNSRVRDTYYWYYATQVLKHAGGDRWETWSSKLHPLLVGTQETSGPYQGSWHPFDPVPDRWGPQGGRLYVTTMNLLSLEVQYRLLPLYENTIK